MLRDLVDNHCNTIHWYIAALVQCNTISQCENTGTLDGGVMRGWALTLNEEQMELFVDYLDRTVKDCDVMVSNFICRNGLAPFEAMRLTFSAK